MNGKKKVGALALVVVAVGVVTFLVLRPGGGDRGWLEASGTVEATETRLGFQAPGRLSEIQVREGDRVEAGTELARLDVEELLARREQAEGGLEAARALLTELERGSRSEEVAQARSARDAARQKLLDAEREAGRASRLFEAGAISQQALERARLNLDVTRSQFEQAAEQLGLVESGPRQERVDAQRAQVRQAEAAVRSADVALENAVVRAPFAGLVTVRHREPGSVVPSGSPVVTVMDPDDRWVRIYVSGDRIGAVRVGSPARITADTDPSREYAGEVVHIASEAEFTPKNVQTHEERVKLVYAVKVRVTDDPGLDLKPGMPADVRLGLVELETESRPGTLGDAAAAGGAAGSRGARAAAGTEGSP
jgi:HlyD family secretion protein